MKDGTRVEANWGAMYPLERGTVVGYSEKGHEIEWDNGKPNSVHRVSLDKPLNGSPIGVFVIR